MLKSLFYSVVVLLVLFSNTQHVFADSKLSALTELKFVPSNKGMSHHGIEKERAEYLVSLVVNAFPNLEGIPIVHIRKTEEGYEVTPEQMADIVDEYTLQGRESYLLDKELKWVEQSLKDQPDVRVAITAEP